MVISSQHLGIKKGRELPHPIWLLDALVVLDGENHHQDATTELIISSIFIYN